MKKALLYFFAFLFICFFLPAIFTDVGKPTNAKEAENLENQEAKTKEEKLDNTKTQNPETENAEIQEKETQDSNREDTEKYKDINIKLLHSKTGEIEEVKIENYLCHVVSAEMPADYQIEALKAQAIVARTYTMYKIKNKKHENADICDNSACCQAWVSKEERLARWEESKRESNWQKIEQSVNETRGKIITYQNEPINAFFHANSGGKTEIPVNVWGGTGLPYLQVVETAGEEGYTQYASEVELTHEEILNKLKEKYPDIQIDFSKEEEIQIKEHTDGQRVKTIKFGNHELSGVETRTIFGLKSAKFEIIKSEGKIKFTVKGYGHGVGMSQTGADALAKQGKTAEEIIHHFYRNIEIKNIKS